MSTDFFIKQRYNPRKIKKECNQMKYYEFTETIKNEIRDRLDKSKR